MAVFSSLFVCYFSDSCSAGLHTLQRVPCLPLLDLFHRSRIATDVRVSEKLSLIPLVDEFCGRLSFSRSASKAGPDVLKATSICRMSFVTAMRAALAFRATRDKADS